MQVSNERKKYQKRRKSYRIKLNSQLTEDDKIK